ncbi:hypothetical protein STXM2123_3959 [Streptomyces sp. F-3]|nr:hypothetical protein STXM2123_3959 [Streptomyces sp. F-3]
MFDPAVVTEGQTFRELSGAALEEWARSRGGNLHVIAPQGITRQQSAGNSTRLHPRAHHRTQGPR